MRNVMSDECVMEKEAYFLLKERRRPHFPQNCGKNPTYQYVSWKGMSCIPKHLCIKGRNMDVGYCGNRYISCNQDLVTVEA